jgi:hypothetical protein
VTDDRETQAEGVGHFSSLSLEAEQQRCISLLTSSRQPELCVNFLPPGARLPDLESFVVQQRSIIIPLFLVYQKRQAATKKLSLTREEGKSLRLRLTTNK